MRGKVIVIVLCCLVGLVLLYGGVCCGITFIPMLRMNKVNEAACGEGSEAAEVVVLENEAKLYAFPTEGVRDKYVVVCPGGGYVGCSVEAEGFPVAAELNKMGYSAFVLEYRTGDQIATPKAPLDDLANAIRYIDENADKYNVFEGYYVLCGFSAGGNLIGLFGTEDFGYSCYDLNAPNALIMGYPWSNPTTPTFNGNIADYLFERTLNGNGAKAFLHSDDSFDEMRVPLWVYRDYPRTFIMHGTADTVVPAEEHSDVLAGVLEENGIEYRYKKCEGVGHGCGLGLGTSAEGWLAEAMAFSCEKWYEEEYPIEPTTCAELKEKADGFICGVCHPQNRYEQLAELGSDWVRFDIPCLPFDRNGNTAKGYADFKADAMEYVQRGFKVFAVTPTPRLLVDTGFDPRKQEDIPLIMEQLRFMAEDLQGLVSAFQVMNEQTETLFREPLTLEESAEFMGMSLRVLSRYKQDIIVGYNLSGNGFGKYLGLLKKYNKYTDFIGLDVYLGCFERTTHNLGFVPATAWMWYVWELTERPILLTEFGYISDGDKKTDEQKLSMLLSYGAQGATFSEAEAYARSHITEILENDHFPPGLRNYLRVVFGEDEAIAGALFGGSEIGVDFSAHLYLELGEDVNVAGYPHTPQGQAQFFADFFENAVYDCEYLCGVIMYSLNDSPFCGYCWQEDCPVETRWGLLTTEGEKKPSFDVVRDAFERCKTE